jgi:hypothetical protein
MNNDSFLVPANDDMLIVELDDRLEFSVISPANVCARPADVNLNCKGTCNNYQCGG